MIKQKPMRDVDWHKRSAIVLTDRANIVTNYHKGLHDGFFGFEKDLLNDPEIEFTYTGTNVTTGTTDGTSDSLYIVVVPHVYKLYAKQRDSIVKECNLVKDTEAKVPAEVRNTVLKFSSIKNTFRTTHNGVINQVELISTPKKGVYLELITDSRIKEYWGLSPVHNPAIKRTNFYFANLFTFRTASDTYHLVRYHDVIGGFCVTKHCLFSERTGEMLSSKEINFSSPLITRESLFSHLIKLNQ